MTFKTELCHLIPYSITITCDKLSLPTLMYTSSSITSIPLNSIGYKPYYSDRMFVVLLAEHSNTVSLLL
jgi:hypothetical protein